MRLGADVLVEIMSIVQSGLLGQVDVSEDLRKIDVVEDGDEVILSREYLEEMER